MANPSAPSSGMHGDRYRNALQALDSGIALIDPQGCWIDANAAFARLLGDRDACPLGTAAALCVADDERDRLRADLDACLRDGARFDSARVWRHGDDGTCRLRTRITPVTGSDGAIDAAIVQLDPADDAGAAEDAMRRPLQLFADKVAHDLRAPLRSIESFSMLLAKRAAERLDDTDRNHLARIRAAAERMSSLLVALGEYSRAMQAELRPAAVDLSLVAEWVGAELREADPERDAELHVQPGLVAWGDERLLKLMFTQLLGNAWKFVRPGEPARIEVTGEHDGARLQVHVRDHGCGFDMQYSHKLFEPFQRLHGVEHGGGHGLGLAIAQCIAQRHRGGIRAESQPDTGSVFTIELPSAATADKVSDA
ncbi:ATP-binding protein [Lysobacter korlensis]|uniref:histidine kinase n=1 Tax=Lysobacter korlensis TaxID=553636 RepID=A0ABV6RKL8_9GAMM